MDWDPPDTWARMADYLRHVPDEAGASPPKALVVVSGHWEEPVVTIQNNPSAPPFSRIITDSRRARMRSNSRRWGRRTCPRAWPSYLGAAAIAGKYDDERGFDHGVFSSR